MSVAPRFRGFVQARYAARALGVCAGKARFVPVVQMGKQRHREASRLPEVMHLEAGPVAEHIHVTESEDGCARGGRLPLSWS